MSTYLVHHGILGQKWGVRRFRNKDGTLTAAGRKRLLKYRESKENSEKHERFERSQKKKIEDAGVIDGTITKGATLYRLAGEKDNVNVPRTYASPIRDDMNAYSEDALDGLLGWRPEKGELSVFEYVPNEDIKVVSAEQQFDYLFDKYGSTPIKDLYKDEEIYADSRKEIVKDFVEKYGDTPISSFRSDIEYLKKNPLRGGNDPKGEFKKYRDYEASMEELEHLFKTTTLHRGKKYVNGDPYLTENQAKMQKHFESLGYKALVDLEDYQGTDYPVILLDPGRNLNLKKVWRYI